VTRFGIAPEKTGFEEKGFVGKQVSADREDFCGTRGLLIRIW